MKPVIGVVADVQAGGKHVAHSVQQKYLAALAFGAHATPVILPSLIAAGHGTWPDAQDMADILDSLDGLFLTGALSNVAPSRYGAELADAASPSDAARDEVSLGLVTQAVRRGLPVLGVCRGCQEINVALGGTLHQAVHETPGLDDHRERAGLPIYEQYEAVHEVTLTQGGLLHAFSGMQAARVNSLHGQGVDRLAPPLAVDAIAPDGLVEAFRLARGDGFLLGVQWHPEWSFADDPLSAVIFRAFGTACRAYRDARTRQHEPLLA